MNESNDLSAAFEKVREMLSDENGEAQIQKLLGMLGSQDADGGEACDKAASSACFDPFSLFSESGQGGSGEDLDLDMLAKLQRLLSVMSVQKNDPNSAFLQALKPFLKEERREKIDRAQKIVKLTNVIKLFKEIDKGGG